ncbi:hypothetical protein BaRGS_00034221, partial [Batillaria attramentaria]
VVLTASKRNGHAVMRLERRKQDEINMMDVHHVAGGPYKGILINKVALDMDSVDAPEARLEFMTYLSKRDPTTANGEGAKDKWELKFWFRGRADGLTRKRAFTEYFQELINPKDLPKNYIGFVKRALVLLQKSRLIKRVELEVEERDGLFPEEELPPIKSFVSVFTPDNYCYMHVPEVPVNNKNFLTFKIKTAGEAYIALSAVYGDLERKTYEIVLGAEENSKSFIRDSSLGPIKAEAQTVNLLSDTEFRYFWISWTNNMVEVGRGARYGQQQFLRWKVPPNKQFHVNCMAVSTSRVGKGEWEFAEILEEKDFHKEVKRAKMKLSLLWLAKKQRMLQLLEDAYPDPLHADVIFKKSVVKQSDNITAIVMLKDLQKKGLVKEVEHGIWIRMQSGEERTHHDVQLVKELPAQTTADPPTVAIITGLFEEKLAVDAMLDNKTTFVKYRVDGESQVYTLGKVGKHRVVSTKLSRKGEGEEAHIASENTVTRLLETFNKVEHVLVVGVGGAVPHYSDHTKHVRLGDVVVSMPQDSSGAQYIYCVEKIPKTVGYSYMTQTWGSRDQTLISLVKSLRQQVEMHSYRDRPWDACLEQGKEALKGDESSFHRPPIHRDKLFFHKQDGSMVQCDHPRPRSMYSTRGFKEGQVNVHYGLVGSGKIVARAEDLRRDFAQLNVVKAFDSDYFPVFESLEGSDKDSFMVIRGCCDYTDGTKKEWRPYAALAAAAVMKSIVLKL